MFYSAWELETGQLAGEVSDLISRHFNSNSARLLRRRAAGFSSCQSA